MHASATPIRMRPPLARRGAVCVLALALAPAASRAVAQSAANYQSYIIGEHALGIGGAFTGIADDVSASYYNPAGLAYLSKASVSASISFRSYTRRHLEGGFIVGDEEVDFDQRSFPNLPTFFGGAIKVGRKDRVGTKRHVLAIANIQPRSFQSGYKRDVEDNAGNLNAQVSLDTSEEATWLGPSYAYRVSDRLSFGGSLFLSLGRVRHSESQILFGRDTEAPSAVSATSQELNQNAVDLKAFHLVFRLGTLWRPAPRWSLGLMFQPPVVPLKQSAEVSELSTFAPNAAGVVTLLNSDKQRVGADWPFPWELRLGASHLVGKDWLLAADLSIYGAMGGSGRRVQTLDARTVDPVTGVSPNPGFFFPQRWRTRPTANLSLGMEYTIRDKIPTRLGLFTDISGFKPPSTGTATYQPASINGVGLSGSVGYRSRRYNFSIGVASVFGRGRALAVARDLDFSGPVGFERTTARTRAVYVFASGATATAERLAEDAYKKIDEKYLQDRRSP